ncbi:major facilitator superfamily domain-containing protein 5 [Corynespora cassiicola Philippines]|uniref:Molybdate-anion transporter n=1 Tax=Corynespora cassiicola Philippines TaxID=1448308 RepID=A0A2T2PBS7_CORCC|nr:major facilitator superfamily domain-containing protein 5 [Corynespora cassiicola Philippines]
MDLYRTTFAGWVLLNGLVFYRSYRSQNEQTEEKSAEKVEHRGRENEDAQKINLLKWRFFPIYLLVNGADWLQGPYIYPIYKDEKGLAEELVAILFMIGFLSGGISGSFVGSLADRCGRRAACLAYCVIYSLSCLTLLTDCLPVLFFGRVLGGVSATLLYSVFDSWLVAEFNQMDLEEPGSTLSEIFSTMTTLNSVIAVTAGIFAEWVVGVTGTAKAPFMVSMLALCVAFVAISRCWGENYGDSKLSLPENASLLEEQGEANTTPTKSPWKLFMEDANVRVLALTLCVFEGSLFLFIFFKFPALTLAHKVSGRTGELPFGLIFAILMCSMMLGSMLYNIFSHSSTAPTSPRMLSVNLAVAALCFLTPTHIRDEAVTLWCFCLFELCCGIYYPLMGELKGRLIEDGVRASVYGMLRVPLNAFVVLALSTTKEGQHHRDMMFTVCSGLLLVAAVVVHRNLS